MIIGFICLYYFAINGVLFIAMGADKRFAIKRARRISEKTLFTLACFGGALGGFLGMRVFRHKTRKLYFYVS